MRKHLNHFMSDRLYIVKSAMGNRPLRYFKAGGEDSFRTKEIRNAVNNLVNQGFNVRVTCVFAQGESDDGNFDNQTVNQKYNPEDYHKVFKQWKEYVNEIVGDVPIIMLKIREVNTLGATVPGRVLVSRIQSRISQSDSNIYLLSTNNLPDIGDNIHYNNEAYRSISDMVINVYKSIYVPTIISEPLSKGNDQLIYDLADYNQDQYGVRFLDDIWGRVKYIDSENAITIEGNAGDGYYQRQSTFRSVAKFNEVPESAEDMTVTWQQKHTPNNAIGGIALRYNDDLEGESGYLFRFNSSANNVILYSLNTGSYFTTLGTFPFTFNLDTWYYFKASVIGNVLNLDVSNDGATYTNILNVVDTNERTKDGSVGIITNFNTDPERVLMKDFIIDMDTVRKLHLK